LPTEPENQDNKDENTNKPNGDPLLTHIYLNSFSQRIADLKNFNEMIIASEYIKEEYFAFS
jgi:hypothetical protein